MKTTLLSSAVAAVMFATCLAWACLSGGQASAQAPMGPGVQGPGGIALVDMTLILRNHSRLKSEMNGLKARADASGAEFEKAAQAIQDKARALNADVKPGSPEFSQKEEALLNEQSALKTRAALVRKEFEQQESKLLYGAYKEVSEDVAAYCRERGIVLVLNFSRTEIRPEMPTDVRYALSKPVIYYQGQPQPGSTAQSTLDITDIIMPRFVQPVAQQPMGVGGNVPYTAQPTGPGSYNATQQR